MKLQLLSLVLFLAVCGWAKSDDAVITKPADQGPTIGRKPRIDQVQWRDLFKQSFYFASIQHSFRVMTEPGTRDGVRGSYWSGWRRSITSLHGWSDGDPFYVNYVGHPMQGAASGYLWVQNDPAYKEEQFGLNRRYWRSRMRAMGFAWLYSTQFEVGLLSEAMIGKIQAKPPQQGFVDHVITPAVGVGGWMVAEDAVDRYLIRWFEGRVENKWARMMMRSWLNPSRSFANVMRGEAPWHRDSRGGIVMSNPMQLERPRKTDAVPFGEPMSEVAPYEFTANARFFEFGGGHSGGLCSGAGATAAMRLSASWQAIADVGGCKLAPAPDERGGDILMYGLGSRWTAARERWRPHFQVTVGGQKVTLDKTEDGNGFAIDAGGGLDFRLNRAVAWRVANVEFRKAWMPAGPFEEYRRSVSFTSGLILQMGTW